MLHLSLSGYNVVITGGLRRMTRDAAFSRILMEGGVPSDNLNKKTDILVVADEFRNYKSGKIDKAEKYGIEIMCEDDFYEMIGEI